MCKLHKVGHYWYALQLQCITISAVGDIFLFFRAVNDICHTDGMLSDGGAVMRQREQKLQETKGSTCRLIIS